MGSFTGSPRHTPVLYIDKVKNAHKMGLGDTSRPEGRVLSKDIQGYRDGGKGRERRDGRREREGEGRREKRGEEKTGGKRKGRN